MGRLFARLDRLERFFRIRAPRFAALRPATTAAAITVASLVAAVMPWLSRQTAADPGDPRPLTMAWLAASTGLLIWWSASQWRSRRDVPAAVPVGLAWSLPVTAVFVACLFAPAIAAEGSAVARLRALLPREDALRAYALVTPYEDLRPDDPELDRAALAVTYPKNAEGRARLIQRDTVFRICDVVLQHRRDQAAVLAVITPERRALLTEACRRFDEAMTHARVDVYALGISYVSQRALRAVHLEAMESGEREYVEVRLLLLPSEDASRRLAVAYGQLDGRLFTDNTARLLFLLLLAGTSAFISLAGVVPFRDAFACLAIQTILPLLAVVFRSDHDPGPPRIVDVGAPLAAIAIVAALATIGTVRKRRSRASDLVFCVVWLSPLSVLVAELAANPGFFGRPRDGQAAVLVTLGFYAVASMLGSGRLTALRRAPQTS